MSRDGEVRIGTSGWSYDSWQGPFYPRDLSPPDWLAEYQHHFRTVEINSTFYALPTKSAVVGWDDATAKSFRFAVKASRYLTHNKKLLDPAEPLERLFESIDPLGSKLGPILFQLPPRWRCNVERLGSVLAMLPPEHRYAFEFRDRRWLTSEVYDALAQHGAALCLYDLAGERSPVEVTADFVYVRLHGPKAGYRGRYDGRALVGWARRLHAWRMRGIDAYVYFDNDQGACAPADAARLLEMVARYGDEANRH